MVSAVDVVLIGRNEGARLVAALASVAGQARQVVYVDSGSTDDSVAEARRAGARVVALDLSVPFTAARARNAGFAALDAPDLVQFIDGDCALVPGWLDKGRAFLDQQPEAGLVTGWRAEIAPEASPYNRLCHWEWRRPAGPIRACGGDMMVRAEAWRALGGMTDNVIAAEDDEFCLRLAAAGWGLHRLPEEMTRHDAAMLRFGQWWARAVRTGHGFAQVGALHPGYFATERRRVLAYGLVLPLLFVAGLAVALPMSLGVLALYGYSWSRALRRLRADGVERREARRLALLLTLSKFPNLVGIATYHLRRLRGTDMRLIEYK